MLIDVINSKQHKGYTLYTVVPVLTKKHIGAEIGLHEFHIHHLIRCKNRFIQQAYTIANLGLYRSFKA